MCPFPCVCNRLEDNFC